MGFMIFSLSLFSSSLTTIVLDGVFSSFYPSWESLSFLDLYIMFFRNFGKVFIIPSSNIYLFYSLFSGFPLHIFTHFDLVPQGMEALFLSLPPPLKKKKSCSFDRVISADLSLCSLICFFSNQFLNTSLIFFFIFSHYFSVVWLFIIASISLLLFSIYSFICNHIFL